MEFKLDFSSRVEALEKEIDSYEHPILVLDDGLKICAKNSATRFFVVGAEVGRHALGLFSEEEIANIRNLSDCETMPCVLKCGFSGYGANVHRFGNKYFVVVNPVSSRLYDSLKTVYDRMSGYDTLVSDDSCIGEALVRNIRTKNAVALVTDCLGEALYGEKLSMFNLKTALKRFSDELRAVGVSVDSSSLSLNEREYLVKGTESHMLLLLAVTIFINNGKNGRTIFNTDADESNAFCRIVIESSSEHIGSELESHHRFEGELSESGFWGYMVYLISNANLWETLVEFEEGRTVFTVKFERVTRKNSFILREQDNETAKRVIEVFFGE